MISLKDAAYLSPTPDNCLRFDTYFDAAEAIRECGSLFRGVSLVAEQSVRSPFKRWRVIAVINGMRQYLSMEGA